MALNKLSKPSDQRKALLRGLTTELIWYGKIETTEARAKETRSIAEKIITKAIREYYNTVAVEKNGVEYQNDAPSKLAARRQIMSYLYDIPKETLYAEKVCDTFEEAVTQNLLALEKQIVKYKEKLRSK